MNKIITADIPINDIKRCYVDGKIMIKCPNCGEVITHNFKEHYLCNPEVGKKTDCYFYCDNCDHEYEIPMRVKHAHITIEYDDTKITEV